MSERQDEGKDGGSFSRMEDTCEELEHLEGKTDEELTLRRDELIEKLMLMDMALTQHRHVMSQRASKSETNGTDGASAEQEAGGPKTLRRTRTSSPYHDGSDAMTKARRTSSKNGEAKLQQGIDAIVAFVHAGFGSLLNADATHDAVVEALQPNCSANFEYRFAWDDDCDPDSLDINWGRLNKRILKQAVTSARLDAILAGGKLTAKEKASYRLQYARKIHGYATAEERLESNTDCNWVDLSFVEDSKGRTIYFIEMGDGDATTAEEMDGMAPGEFIEWHESVWHWKQNGFCVFGPFRSEEEAEAWMEEHGAFTDE